MIGETNIHASLCFIMHIFILVSIVTTLVAAHGDPVITAQCASFSRAEQRPNTARANQLGMNQTWYAQMPCTNMTGGTKTTGNQLQDYIQTQWSARKSGFYAPEDVSFVTDPFSSNSTSDDSAVMRVYYQKGSYTPKGSDQDVTGGCQFYMSPFQGQAFKKGLVRYDVAFAENFDWVKGGKLPGIFGGKLVGKRQQSYKWLIHWIGSHGTRGCTGGDMADGDNCFSVRLMWRENGMTME